MKAIPNICWHKASKSWRFKRGAGKNEVCRYLKPAEDLQGKALWEWLTEERKNIVDELDGIIDMESKPKTLGELIDEYLKSPALTQRGSTLRNYTAQGKKIKAHKIGGKQFDKVTSIDLQEYVNGQSSGVQEQTRTVLRNVYKYANDKEYTSRNPAMSLKLKTSTTIRKKKPPNEYYSRKEIGDMLNKLAEYKYPRIGAYAVAQLRLWAELSVSIGPRYGEALGLAWADVDLIKKTVFIHQQLWTSTNEIYPETKTGKDRTNDLLDRVVDLFVEYKALQQQERERNGWEDSGMVFTNLTNGGLIPYKAIDKRYKRFCKVSGLTYRSTHAFRHFFATALYKATKDVTIVAEAIGDTEETVWRRYVHTEEEDKGTVRRVIADVIADCTKPPKTATELS
jgi:integrase